MIEAYRMMKQAGLSPAEMVLEVLMAVAVFAIPISLMFTPGIVAKIQHLLT